jgi:hypothetical protein
MRLRDRSDAPVVVVDPIATELGGPRHIRFNPDSDRTADIPGWQLRADCVAKLFLDHWRQIFRAVGAAIE